MRVTFRELNRHMQHVINDRYRDLSDLQLQLSTGKRLQRPSDDPQDVANDLNLTSKGKSLVQYKKNIQDGMAYMGVSDTALTSLNTLLQRTRELAIEGSTDTMGIQERKYINKEVEQLFRQAIALINTQYKGDYIFSGTQTKIPPFEISSSKASAIADYNNLQMSYFDASTLALGSSTQILNGFDDSPITNIIPGTVKLAFAGQTYVEGRDYTIDYLSGNITILSPTLLADMSPGTPNYAITGLSLEFDHISRGKDIYGAQVSTYGEIQREIETNITVPINISADEVFTDQTTGNDAITTFIRFGQALVQNNTTGLNASITEFDSVFSAILSAQSKVGARINRFETTLERNENQTIQTTDLQSELEDAEMAETMSKYATLENVYNAALKSAAKVIQPSLVNFL